MRESNHLLEALDFFGGNAAAKLSDAVIAAALVIQVRIGPLAAFFNRSLVEEFLDRGVKRPGARIERSIGTAANFAQDSVAVALAIG